MFFAKVLFFYPIIFWVTFAAIINTNALTEIHKTKISDYTYELPANRIAKYPLPDRDESNLLIWEKGTLKKDVFKNIPSYLRSDSLLVFNNTRVIHARLHFIKKTGAKIEIFCLEPVQPSDYQLAFQQTKKVVWKCMVGNAKKWKDEILTRKIEIKGTSIELKAKIKNRENNEFIVEFNWTAGVSYAAVIEKAGVLPIPPYLNRETEPADETAYQTIYAKTDGSVAAPTAGLHFTEKVLSDLSEKKIALREITLHVGAGTFRPVKSQIIGEHDMHRETVIISKKFIEELLSGQKKTIAVGTTSVRSLESLYWLGLKFQNMKVTPEKIEVTQWEPYLNEASISVSAALLNILNFLASNNLNSLQFTTQIIIVPGYRFQLTEGMITNFHQPQSTLLLLIGAFLGNDWREVYSYAMKNNFRFLSYGDSNLYLK